MTDTITNTVSIDHLFVSEQGPIRTAAVTVADSQTCLRGAAMGKVLYGAVTAVADAGNTGDGTCTALATVLGSIKPIIGDYILTCIEAVTHGGVFKLVDPNGGLVSGALAMTAATGGATVLEAGGITFTLTDDTDFIVGDFFTISVAAGSGSVIKLDKTAVDGSADIYGILSEAVTTDGATQVSSVYLEGKFNSGVVTFVTDTAYTDIEADARLKNIYFAAASY